MHVLDLGGKNELRPSGKDSAAVVYFASLIPTASLCLYHGDGEAQGRRNISRNPRTDTIRHSGQKKRAARLFLLCCKAAGQSPFPPRRARGCPECPGRRGKLPGSRSPRLGQDVGFGIALSTSPAFWSPGPAVRRGCGVALGSLALLDFWGLAGSVASLSGSAPLQRAWQPTEGRYAGPLPPEGHTRTPYPIGLG